MLNLLVEIATAIVTLFVTPQAAEGLRRTAPMYLTVDTAREHVAASLVVGLVTRTDPAVLMSISHHEGNHRVDVRTPEPGSRCTQAMGRLCYSCGTMTPEPIPPGPACELARSSLAQGYLAGAQHLRGWLDDPRCRGDLRCALWGYGGKAVTSFLWRARWIEREISRSSMYAVPNRSPGT